MRTETGGAFRDVAGVVVVDGDTALRIGSAVRNVLDDGLPCVVVTATPREFLDLERQVSVLTDLRGARGAALPDLDDVDAGWLRVVGTNTVRRGLTEAFRLLAEIGIGAGLVAVVGAGTADIDLAGGSRALPASFAELSRVLGARRAGRARGRVPGIDEDPRWILVLESDPDDRPRITALESIATLANGTLGTRGVLEDDGEGSPMVVAPGVFDERGESPTLLAGPNWTTLVMRPAPGARERRILDLRTGVLVRERVHGDPDRDGDRARPPLRTFRFVPLGEGPSGVLLAEGPASALAPGLTLHLPRNPSLGMEGREGEAHHATVTHEHGGIVAYGHTVERLHDGIRTIERIVGIAADGDELPDVDAARAAHLGLRRRGVDSLLARHRATWARRWADAEVSIDGDPELERSVRFALFHLLSSVDGKGEAPVGPRGLTGVAYGGHVLWDADVFVLPALAAIFPDGARAMLEYRVRRLEEARRIAASQGYAGARFPWESGRDGRDVTPHLVRRSGQIIPILTGWREEHVVADVAWAASHYADWTGDEEFIAGPGAELVVECARYWASRIRVERPGHAHIYGVVGPDEYHEIVDDNAYTNGMARWNLRRAAEVAPDVPGVTAAERDAWLELADALGVGYHAASGVHEQFTGFFKLDRALADLLPGEPVMADEQLGRLRVKASQIVKQPDVLMLHHLVPDDLEPGSLARDLDYYGPLTAHGSSLSPAIHASLLARAGRPDEALQLLSVAARLDLDDLTRTTGRGLHLATMGGLWQAVAHGFLGLRPCRGALSVDPVLPRSWNALSVATRFLGSRVQVEASHTAVKVRCERPLPVSIAGRAAVTVDDAGRYFPLVPLRDPARSAAAPAGVA